MKFRQTCSSFPYHLHQKYLKTWDYWTLDIPIIMVELYLYSISPILLASWSSYLLTTGASSYYNMIIVIILQQSFDEHVHCWYSNFIELVENEGLVLTYDLPSYLWFTSLSLSFHFISHHQIDIHHCISLITSSSTSSLWWISLSTFS